ncbi:Zn-dependent protease with chaperone function [Aquabacterium commune]|uniref:Zn-dependent protease with chaperone function n=1 Tax=Aquabacterium commune TaxID=70586 RepID=A0A4R6RPF3_9BURK|nr:M48 family metalloprotease [Aquabacterium commune]TDP88504.1 Zn-dependent protease with chaperone function [Aquabacterium commune]
MQFREHQQQAQARTVRLFACFALLLLALTAFINLFLALAWRLLTPFGHGYPALFFEANTAVVMLFVLGGCWVESQRLKSGGGPRVARWLGGRPVQDEGDALSRRLLNVVDEMAIASGQPVPQVFVLPREDAINAFVAGWGPQDTVLCVTRGALERLQRAELQGLVAHEFGHLQEDDLPLTMRMLALVWGLSLVHGWGQSLMDTDDAGHVTPLRWLAGVVFAGVGWLGWLAGRLLQAAVTRQREFLADACAVQFTRTRDGLGGVLRKVWYDQEVLAGRMRHPAADMVSALLLHNTGGSPWLATHPPLPERIRRICGSALPPLPAPLIRLEATEPRRVVVTSPVPEGALAAATPFAAQASLSPGELRRQQLAADREALERLRLLGGPTELRLLVLALMMDPDNGRECKLWRQLADGVHQSERILADVAMLLPARHVPEFERVTDQVREAPIEQRRTLVEHARDLLRADGKVSPRDRLWWLALRHRVGEHRPTPGQILRPIANQGEALSELNAEQRHHAAALTAYLARLVPCDSAEATLPAANTAWFAAVMKRCGALHQPGADQQMPDADALAHALSAIQELSWMLRPQLLKAWVEEAFNHSPHGVLSDASADALRLTARLLDAPLPPMLEAHYPRA